MKFHILSNNFLLLPPPEMDIHTVQNISVFPKKICVLDPMNLCGNNLPLVESSKLLGNYIETKANGMVRTAKFISKNNNIHQNSISVIINFNYN